MAILLVFLYAVINFKFSFNRFRVHDYVFMVRHLVQFNVDREKGKSICNSCKTLVETSKTLTLQMFTHSAAYCIYKFAGTDTDDAGNQTR